MKRHKDFWQVTEDSLDKSMKAYEIDSSMRNELLDLYKILSPFKEVPEVLKSLKEKDLRLAILSNGTPSLLRELVKSNKLDNLLMIFFQ
jgi:2-haloacid dehalogenase